VDCPPDHQLPENSKENLDTKLDHAIEETFPTSDPVSVKITKGGAIDYDQPEAASSAPPQGQNQEGQGTVETLLNQAKETLGTVAGTASGSVGEAVNQGRRYVRQASERYPQVERSYQESGRAIRQQVAENPWPALVLAGAVGYALAWMIHGQRGGQNERLPEHARTRRGYAPHREEQRG
jgi:ElaB/YqjD/DUF883 family membrane-anchored ribosome-binding protein